MMVKVLRTGLKPTVRENRTVENKDTRQIEPEND